MSELMNLSFADDAERQRYWRLREMPEMQQASGIGLHVARKHVVPLVLANGGRPLIRNSETGTFETVETMAAKFLGLGYGWAEAHIGRPLGDDGQFMFRVAFAAEVARATAEATRVATAAEKLGEAFALALAGVTACNEGLAMLGGVQPSAPTPHALSMSTKRPLRPEDFGALPVGPRR